MSTRAIARAGLLDVLDRPLAITLEVLWRWSFGSLTLILTAIAVVHALAATNISEADQHAIFLSGDPQRAVVSAMRIAAALGPRLLAQMRWLLPVCSLAYWLLSTVGRALVLAVLAEAPSPDARPLRFREYVRGVALLQALRVVVFWVAAALGYAAIFFAARLAAPDFTEMDTVLRYYLILLPLWLLIAVIWSVTNFMLAIAPATLLRTGLAMAPLRTLGRRWNSDWLRVTWQFATLRTLAATIAFVLSFIVAGWGALLSWTISAAFLCLISLIYFAVAETFFLARLSAYSRIGAPAMGADEVHLRGL